MGRGWAGDRQACGCPAGGDAELCARSDRTGAPGVLAAVLRLCREAPPLPGPGCPSADACFSREDSLAEPQGSWALILVEDGGSVNSRQYL